jgi:DnaJ-domain-containing protein 1
VHRSAKSYPRFYRDRLSFKQWQNYRSNSQQFTYDFTEPFEEQQQQHQQRQRKKSSFTPTIDLYELLSINRSSTEKEIKRAYLSKAKELHPDRHSNNKEAEELFKKVNEAYTILSDKYKREQYDKYGYESVKYR